MGKAVLGALGAVSQIGSTIGGAISSANASGEAKTAAQQAFQELEKLGLPPDQSAPLVLEKLKQQGLYTPELEQAINTGVSQVSQIQEQPGLRDAQTKALQSLQQVGGGGLRIEDRAAFNELRRKAAQEGEAKRQQILQNMAARGMAGSGAELAAQLSAAQAGEEGLAAAGERQAAEASQRALQALSSAGQLGGQIRGQDFDINRAKAAAADEMNRFNVQNQSAQQARNIQAKNVAQQQNLSEQQRVADVNAAMGNAELLRQQQAQRQFYADKAGLAKAKSDALTGQAKQRQDEAKAAAETSQQIGSGLGGIFQSLAKPAAQIQKAPTAVQSEEEKKKEADNIYAATGIRY